MMIFLGIALFIAGWWYHGAIVLGALVTGLALFVQVKGKSYIQFAFYPDYFVVFTQEDSDHCQKIDWKDVKEWTIDTNHGTAFSSEVSGSGNSRNQTEDVPSEGVAGISVSSQIEGGLPQV